MKNELTNIKPLVTIITVVFNCEKFIENTIKSVTNKLNFNVEYIIIDGGSKDKTLEIIKKYDKVIDYWVSEPDKGIYDAMNKGITKAKGEFVYFINSGDILIELPLEILEKNHDCKLVAFPVELSSNEIKKPKINNSIRIRNTLPHQGCFYKKTPSLKYNTLYKVFADFHLNQKMYKNNNKMVSFNYPIVAFHDLGGVSNDKNNSSEIFKVVYDNHGVVFTILSFFYFKKEGFLLRIKNLF